ncbi:MAG TPA: hypothetical protein VK890_08685, partial [Bacteroidia bacterium]|nr:hypothetical protein [Bacteroidia bacterium]
MKELWNKLKGNWIFWLIVIIIISYIYFYIHNYLKGAATQTQYQAAIASTGQIPTLTVQQADNICNDIYSSLSEDWFNNFDDTKTAFSKI